MYALLRCPLTILRRGYYSLFLAVSRSIHVIQGFPQLDRLFTVADVTIARAFSVWVNPYRAHIITCVVVLLDIACTQ